MNESLKIIIYGYIEPRATFSTDGQYYFFGGPPALPGNFLERTLATIGISIRLAVDPGEPVCALPTDKVPRRSSMSLDWD